MTIADEIVQATLVGDPAPPIARFVTGLYSFDRAFENARGDIGMPVGTGYEVFGTSNTGKSTLCYSLASILAKNFDTNIALADLEGFDSDFLLDVVSFNKFSNNIQVINQGTDEEILDTLATKIESKEFGVGILDSIGAIVPIGEQSGDLGAANMGQRARLMAQFVRRLLPTMNPRTPNSTNIVFLVNHYYPMIGSRGWDTPGGESKKYLCGVRFSIKRKEEFPDGSYVLSGQVKKNRYGFRDKKFHLFIKAGLGLHKGLTALIDGTIMEKVNRSRTVKIGEESFGYLKDIITVEYKNDEFFEPFYKILEEEDVPEKVD